MSETRPAALAIAGLGKWYGAFHALKRIDLTVAPGECVVLCGPAGSGKSALIRCINRLEPFQAGTVTIDGALLPAEGPALVQARQRIGMVFHDINLFAQMSAVENCAWALRQAGIAADEAGRRAMAMLARVQMADHAHALPGDLTPGQQQRVAIARALSPDPAVMLFDEPTGTLSPVMAAEVLEVMAELAASGMTMVCATDDMGFARRAADRVVFMDGGSIVEVDTPERFLSRPSSARAQAYLAQIL